MKLTRSQAIGAVIVLAAIVAFTLIRLLVNLS